MLQLANPEGAPTLSAKQAVTFFMKSGVPVGELKGIWDISARTSNEYLTKEEFYVALRLIAYKQNNINATEDAIKLNTDAPLPTF